MKLKVTLDENQLNTMLKALDFYARMGCGQFDEMVYLEGTDISKRDEMDRHFVALKKIMLDLNPNTYTGIFASKDTYKTAYDIFKTCQHAYSWHKHPEGGMTVNFDKPIQASNVSDLPEVEIIPCKCKNCKCKK